MKNQLVTIVVTAAIVACAAAVFFWMNHPQPSAAVAKPDFGNTAVTDIALLSEPIQPLPKPTNLDPRKVALGRRLFSDVRLSVDNSISCNSCHNLATSGADGLSVSVGIGGISGEINAPTVFNCALNFRQFWDGRVETLEQQIEGPTQHPKEMGSSWAQIIEKLSLDSSYVRDFSEVYPRGIQSDTIKDAIACFERSLITLESRFDQYLRGDKNALTERERKGYDLFKQFGCISCHQGMNAGGNMFQPFGIMGDYFSDRGNITKADLGRFNVTGAEQDRFKFRVPGLRNVELTAPYFHDGSAKTLEDAVRIMARYQIGQVVSDEEVSMISEFLRTLTGKRPESLP